jgi:UDP-N-acetyl-D-mannosaminuronic acid transferase (WecB/TagA/CpsF family)
MSEKSRLLIAAGAAAPSPKSLPFGVRELIDAADEILVVTPSLPTRFEWLASATDKAREQADERLEAVLGQLDVIGTEAAGATGSDDPIEALADAIQSFGPDHLLIALRAGEQAGWQERGLLDRIQERFAVPMTVFPATPE